MIDITNESGVAVGEEGLVALARFTLAKLYVHPQAELSILLVDEETMAAYHQQFMDEEGPTDVLSFPMDELTPGEEDRPSAPGVLGDVVLCPAVTARQAAESHRTAAQEQDYLLVHGLLHLLGFDHDEPASKQEMFELNDAIIAAWGTEDHRRWGAGR